MHKAKKSLGQNFLHDESVLAAILEAAELKQEDTVLEVGPGKGALTHGLLEKSGKVIAVEYDDDLIPLLQEEFGEDPKFELRHEDALQFTPPSGPYKIVANLPYYITSPLINHFLLEQFQGGNPPSSMVIMIQKEVAEKILAEKRHSVLSLQVHLFGEPELVCMVPAEAFTPAPKVDSAVIKIKINPEPKISGDLKNLFWLFHVSFAQKRKKLANNLGAALRKKPAEIKEILTELGIDPDARAEALKLEEWKKVFDKGLDVL